MATPTEPLPLPPSANGDLADRVQQLRLTDQLGAGRATNRGAWLPWVLCAVMAVVWAGTGIRWYKAPPAAAPQAGAPKGAAPGAPPPAAEGELILPITGKLAPSLQINLSPLDVAGEVLDIFFKEGDLVKKGQKLATIRDDRYRNDYDAAKAALEAARHRLADLGKEAVRPAERKQAEAELAEAKAGWLRADQEVNRLSAKTAGVVVSKQDLERADADLRAAEARVARLEAALELLNLGARQEKLRAAQADVDQAEARFKEADRLLKNCVIVAPIDGTILTKVADRGALVSPMSFNVAAGICTMADLADLEAEIDVPEKQILRIREGLDCRIFAEADQSRQYRGWVDRVMPIADDSKNVIKVRVKIVLPRGEPAGSFLKPKMSVVVNVYNRPYPWWAHWLGIQV
jgi:multidrug efflux pump subunit AcrA (membrane-fusion protein)